MVCSYCDDCTVVGNLLVFVKVGETLGELHLKSGIFPGLQCIVGLFVIGNGLGVVLGVGEAGVQSLPEMEEINIMLQV